MLLVPGFTGSKEDFIAVLPILQALDWHAVAIDMPGQYESTGPHDADAYSLEVLSSSILSAARELRAQTGKRVHILGHSFGGLVVRNALLEDDSADPSIKSVTFLCSGPGALADESQVGPLRRLISLLPDASLEYIWELKEQSDRANGWVEPSKEVYDFLFKRFTANNPHAMRAAAQVLADETQRLDEVARTLAGRKIPALVTYGDYDDAWSPAIQSEMARIIGASQATFPQTGHSPNAEHPLWCAGALEAFWADAEEIDARPVDSVPPPFGAPIGVSHDISGYNEGMELRVPVGDSLAEVGKARNTLGRAVQAWDLSHVADDLELVASEMVTNAIRYGASPIEFRLIAGDGFLRFEVRDGAAHLLPAPRDAADDEAGGRGLALIEALSTEWGVDIHSDAKTVWATISTIPE